MSPQSDNPGPGVFSRIFENVGTKAVELVALAALIGCAFLVFQVERGKAETKAKAAELAATLDKVAVITRELEGVQGTLIKERDAAHNLTTPESVFVNQIKAADPKATISSTSHTGVAIKDTDTAIATTAAGSPCPSSIIDSHNRFRFELPNGPLYREQKFTLDVVTVRGVDGGYSVQKSDFREFDPTTGQEIPSAGISLEGNFQFVEERAAGPGPWHLRGVAAAAYPLGFGGGVQVNPWRGLTLGPVFLYQPATSKQSAAFVAAFGAGWRVLGSTIAVGPYAGVSSRGGAFVGGALATIEVTR